MKRKFVPVSFPDAYWFEADETSGVWVFPNGNCEPRREPSIYTVTDAESFVVNGLYREVPFTE